MSDTPIVAALKSLLDHPTALATLCRAYDAEDASQKGEASPHDISFISDDDEEFDEFFTERLACAEAAIEAVIADLTPNAPTDADKLVEDAMQEAFDRKYGSSDPQPAPALAGVRKLVFDWSPDNDIRNQSVWSCKGDGFFAYVLIPYGHGHDPAAGIGKWNANPNHRGMTGFASRQEAMTYCENTIRAQANAELQSALSAIAKWAKPAAALATQPAPSSVTEPDNRARLLNQFLGDWEDQLDAEMVQQLHSIVAGIDPDVGLERDPQSDPYPEASSREWAEAAANPLPGPGPTWGDVVQPAPALADMAALERFSDWFRKNYPGPDTIIHKPDWHAPKIFRAVLAALNGEAN